MVSVTIQYLDIPDSKRDSIDYIVGIAKTSPAFINSAHLLQDDHDIYFNLEFGSESVVVSFR